MPTMIGRLYYKLKGFKFHSLIRRSGGLIVPCGYQVLTDSKTDQYECISSLDKANAVGEADENETLENDLDPVVIIDDVSDELPTTHCVEVDSVDKFLDNNGESTVDALTVMFEQVDGAVDSSSDSDASADTNMTRIKRVCLRDLDNSNKKRSTNAFKIISSDEESMVCEADLEVVEAFEPEKVSYVDPLELTDVQNEITDEDCPPSVNSNPDLSTDDCFDSLGIPSEKLMYDKQERPHIKYPSTGRSYVFFKSNRVKGSTIVRYVNDFLNIAEVDMEVQNKPNMSLILDDGSDYGQRGLQTFYFLGLLWKMLDKDCLFIVKNAPGDSKWNCIEHLWGFINKKLSGLILPGCGEDQSLEEAEDEAISLLCSILNGAEYNGHRVHAVNVPCSESSIKIDNHEVNNDIISEKEGQKVQKIMENKSMTKRKLRQEYPEIYSNLMLFSKHCDSRLHALYFRKCLPKDGHVCKFCLDHPVRSSKEFLDCLPARSKGGLFYDAVDDELHPGHFMTLLQLLQHKDVKIDPDGKTDSKRCQVYS